MNRVTITDSELIIERAEKEIVVNAPYFNNRLERVDRVIRYKGGDSPELVIEEGGRRVCGIFGPLAQERFRKLLMINI